MGLNEGSADEISQDHEQEGAMHALLASSRQRADYHSLYNTRTISLPHSAHHADDFQS